MASVTRSSRRVKNEEKRSSKAANSGGRVKDSKTSTASGSATTDSSTLRRSARETSSKKQQLLSLSSNDKKADKVKHQAPSTPLSKRKSVRIETSSTPTPSGRFERWEKRQVLKDSGSRNSDRCSCSSSSRKSDKSSSSSGTKITEKSNSTAVKKSKKRVDSTADGATTTNDGGRSEKVDGGDASTQLKKKRLDARTYRASLGSKPKKDKQSAPDNSSRGNVSVSKKDLENLGPSSLKEAEEGADECSSGKGGLLKEKDVEEHGEETIEASSSTPRKLAIGTSTNDGDRTFSKKRKFSVKEVHGPDFRDSLSEDSNRILQVSPAGYMMTEKEELEAAVDGVKRAKMVCPVQESPATLDVIMIASSEGKSLTAEYDVEEGPTDGQSKKRFSSNFDSDSTDTAGSSAAWNSKNSNEGVSLSSSSRNQGRLSDVCLVCRKPERIVNGSQIQEVCSCNMKRSSEAYQKSEQQNVVAISFGNYEHPSHLSFENGDGLVAREESADVENTSELALSSMHAIEDTPLQLQKDGKGHEVGDAAGDVRDGNSIQQESVDADNNACVGCHLGGKLLCCDGKGCGRSYHLSCLDPPLKDVPFGTWYCLSCVKKKIKFGVHSISEGVESICIINEEGMQNEKKYFVKYRGLSHVHNRWITESQLMQEAPMLMKKRSKEKLTWKKEWTEPQRLLRKRLTIPQEDGIGGSDTEQSDSPYCLHEWLVKWKGLGYDETTWELENEAFLGGSDAKKLMKNYEIWREKARKQSDLSAANEVKDASLSKLSKLPIVGISGFDHHLSSLNKLLENWQKSQNTLVIDEQERITKAILFILALQSHVSRPFLVISTMPTLSHWESEFMHLAPSLNVVVYNGDKSVRKNIQALEFYDESGRVLFEVLLTIPDAITEDMNYFECLGWEAIIVDECHRPRLLKQLNLRMLTAGFKLFLACSQMKDNTSEYLNLLSHLEPDCGSELNVNSIDSNAANLSMLKEKLARYVVSELKSDSSKIVEYWVPVLLSDIQLEQYCRTLLDNTMSLRSCSKNDSVGALRDMLISLRKCCDHPYLVEPSLQTTLTKGVPEILLDVGINASGKLQLLDKILNEVKKKKLRVVVLFQTTSGSGGIGDILDDYLRQRFGQDSYERVDSGLVPSKRQHALNIFNNLERGRFVFLLENRACRSSIKLSSVDAIIIFNSDWNPVTDFKALQKIHIDPQSDQLKVFRLYSPFTVEEKTLILANKDTSLESNVQNISHSISHMLLMWGASYLFDRLDVFHGNKSPCADSNECSYDEMVRDIIAALQSDDQIDKPSKFCRLMSKVHQSGAVYTPTNSLLGERKMLVSDDGTSSLFWTKLLENRFYFWKYLPVTSQRPRKKAKYVDNTSEEADADTDELRRKRHKVANSTIVDPITLQPWIEEQKRKSVSGGKDSKIAAAAAASSSLSEPQLDSCVSEGQPDNGILGTRAADYEDNVLPKTLNCSKDSNCDLSEVGGIPMVESESCRKLRDAQKSLHSLLKPEISKLCETLQFPEEVMQMATKFLEYVMNNHHVNKEPKSILQAFMISLCWRAASLLKYKVNRKESLLRAKQNLEFECKEEEADSVYGKLRQLKKQFFLQINLVRNHTKLKSLEDQASPPNASQAMKLEPVASDQQCLARNATGSSLSNSHSVHTTPLEQESIPPSELSEPDLENDGCNLSQSETNKDITEQIDKVEETFSLRQNKVQETFTNFQKKKVEETFSHRRKEILERQKKEIEEFRKYRDGLKEKIKQDHKLEVDNIRATHADISLRLDKLKLLDENFAKKMKELYTHVDSCHKELVLKQYNARQKEDFLKAHYLEKANCRKLPVPLDSIPLTETGFDFSCMKITEQSDVHNLENLQPIPVRQSQDVVDKVESVTAELLVPAAVPTTSAASQDDNDELILGQSEGITATAVGHDNQENVEGASLDSSSQVDDISTSFKVDNTLPSAQADNLPPSSQVKKNPPASQVDNISTSLVEPSRGSLHDDPVLSHEVPSVEPISAAAVANVAAHFPKVTSSQVCSSGASIPRPVDTSQMDDSQMLISELQQNNEASCSSAQIAALRQQPNACPLLPAEQINHLERQAAAGGSRRTGTLSDPAVLPGPSARPSLILPSAAGRPHLLHPDPLQNELAKIRKEKDLATRMHEEEINQLRLQCEKELEEIRRKYIGLVQEVEMRLNQKLLVLDSHYSKVHFNRVLAGACKLKFDHKLPVHLRQGMSSSASPQLFPQPYSQPPASQMAQLPLRIPGSSPPLQVHNTSALFSGNPGSAHYSPGVPRTFPHGGAEVRAAPPHLSAQRPSPFPSSIQAHLSMSSALASQQFPPNLAPPLTSSSQLPPSYQSFGPIGTHVIDNPGMFPPIRDSALELLKDIDSRARSNHVQPPLAPNAGATLDALLMSELSQDRRPRPTAAVANDAAAAAGSVVCLSDDD